MPVPKPGPNGESSCLVPVPRGRRSREEEVRHLRHRGHYDDDLQPALSPSANDACRPIHCLRILNRGPAKLHHDQFLSRYAQAVTAKAFAETALVGKPSLSSLPSNASTSAFSTAAPAAPRIVLCDSTTNFQSSRLHSRSRPTVAAIPFPRILSNRGCGRSTAASYSTGWSGAVGKCRPCSGRNSLQAARISSRGAFFLNLMLTHSVCPSSTATRLQCALTFASNSSIFRPSSRPSSLPTSS